MQNRILLISSPAIRNGFNGDIIEMIRDICRGTSSVRYDVLDCVPGATPPHTAVVTDPAAQRYAVTKICELLMSKLFQDGTGI